MQTIVIDAKGHKLESGAAESYKRMLIAGMPEGGIAAALRTFEQQLALYKAYLAYKAGKGPKANLAAKPSKTAPHILGRAIDVTRGTAAHTWLTKGGVRLQTKLSEKIRANDFGWKRTVPTEAWHFFYTAANDKYTKGLPVLSFGKRDKYFVPAAQRALGIVNTTTLFGPKSRALTKAFQKKSHLPVTGKVDAKTWAALKLS